MTNKEAIEEIKSIGLIIDAATSGTRRRSIYEALNLAIKALEERPQGKWEFFSVGNIQYSRCSICKDEHISEYTDLDWWYDNFKYCPNCGAKMTKEEENE